MKIVKLTAKLVGRIKQLWLSDWRGEFEKNHITQGAYVLAVCSNNWLRVIGLYRKHNL